MITEIKKSLCILLIEDNSADAFLTREILNDSMVPHTVHVVQDAKKAFAHMLGRDRGVVTHLPDIILLDLNLPVMDGFMFLAEMAKEKSLNDIPVFILSASSEQVDMEKALRSGACGYFEKPLDLDHFETAMRTLFRSAEQD